MRRVTIDPTAPRRERRHVARLLARSCVRIGRCGTLTRVRDPLALAALERLCARIIATAGTRPVAVAIRTAEALALAGPAPPGARTAVLAGTLDPVGAVAFSVLWLAQPRPVPELELALALELPPVLAGLATTPGFPHAGRA